LSLNHFRIEKVVGLS